MTPASRGMPAKLHARASCSGVVFDVSTFCMLHAPDGLLLAATMAAISSARCTGLIAAIAFTRWCASQAKSIWDKDISARDVAFMVASYAARARSMPALSSFMLNYQSTSFHDALYVRDLFGLKRAPEFDDWLMRAGLADSGLRLAGDAGLLPDFASRLIDRQEDRNVSKI